MQSKDRANAISGRYEVEQIEAILLLKLLTSEGTNLSKEQSLPFSVFIIGCRIVRKPFADFVAAFIYFHFTERIVYDSSLILGFTTGRILLVSEGRLSKAGGFAVVCHRQTYTRVRQGSKHSLPTGAVSGEALRRRAGGSL